MSKIFNVFCMASTIMIIGVIRPSEDPFLYLDKYGSTQLHRAVMYGNVHKVGELMHTYGWYEEYVKWEDADGFTAADYVEQYHSDEATMRHLNSLLSGMPPGLGRSQDPSLARRRNISLVDIEDVDDDDDDEWELERDANRCTHLMKAVMIGDVNFVCAILADHEHDPDYVNAVDEGLRTALDWVYFANYEDNIKNLLVDILTQDGGMTSVF